MTSKNIWSLRINAHGRVLDHLCAELKNAGVENKRGPMYFSTTAVEYTNILPALISPALSLVAGVIVAFVNKNQRTKISWNDNGTIKEIEAASMKEVFDVLEKVKEINITDR